MPRPSDWPSKADIEKQTAKLQTGPFPVDVQTITVRPYGPGQYREQLETYHVLRALTDRERSLFPHASFGSHVQTEVKQGRIFRVAAPDETPDLTTLDMAALTGLDASDDMKLHLVEVSTEPPPVSTP